MFRFVERTCWANFLNSPLYLNFILCESLCDRGQDFERYHSIMLLMIMLISVILLYGTILFNGVSWVNNSLHDKLSKFELFDVTVRSCTLELTHYLL